MASSLVGARIKGDQSFPFRNAECLPIILVLVVHARFLVCRNVSSARISTKERRTRCCADITRLACFSFLPFFVIVSGSLRHFRFCGLYLKSKDRQPLFSTRVTETFHSSEIYFCARTTRPPTAPFAGAYIQSLLFPMAVQIFRAFLRLRRGAHFFSETMSCDAS